MNTSISKEQFFEFRNAFKQLARDKKVTGNDIIMYNLVRGFDARRGFTPITNTNKIHSFAGDPDYAFKAYANTLKWLVSREKPFLGKEILGEYVSQVVDQLTAELKKG